MTTKIGNLGIEALAGPTRLKARLQPAITELDRQISLEQIAAKLAVQLNLTPQERLTFIKVARGEMGSLG